VLLIVDLIEHDLATCTLMDGHSIDVLLAWLPFETRPGDHLEVSSDGQGLVQFSIDQQATQQVLERLSSKGNLGSNLKYPLKFRENTVLDGSQVGHSRRMGLKEKLEGEIRTLQR
jgi:hypothetical protein